MFLGNLPPDCKVSDIQEFLEKYGRVRNVLIKQGKYGFAEFDDSRDADDAVYELHGKRLLGSRITLEFAKVSQHYKALGPQILFSFPLRVPREETGEPPGCQSTGHPPEHVTP